MIFAAGPVCQWHRSPWRTHVTASLTVPDGATVVAHHVDTDPLPASTVVVEDRERGVCCDGVSGACVPSPDDHETWLVDVRVNLGTLRALEPSR